LVLRYAKRMPAHDCGGGSIGFPLGVRPGFRSPGHGCACALLHHMRQFMSQQPLRAVSAPNGQDCQLVRPSVEPGPPTRLLGMPVRADPGWSSPASAARSCCRHAAMKIKKA
jgi:hypothetical protein